MIAARALASMASAPSVGPTVRCSTTSTGTGSAPERITSASSSASSWVKEPVICVLPPIMPVPQPTDGSTCGEEITSSSSRNAICLRGSPGGAQAASALTRCQAAGASPWNSMPTVHPMPPCAGAAWAFLMPSPVMTASPSAIPVPAGEGVSPTPVTGWTESCAVRPRTSTASAGSWTPGSSTTMRRSPERASTGSATPSSSTRRRSTSMARSVASEALPSGVSSTICVPPRRSRPRRGAVVSRRKADAARTPRDSSPRTSSSRRAAGRGMGVASGTRGWG